MSSMTLPKFIEKNPEAKADYDLFLSTRQAKRTAPKKKSTQRATGPALFSAEVRISNWSRTASEWTQGSVTGVDKTIEDTGFGLHVAGMRVHANSSNIAITDGSVPMQYYHTNVGNYQSSSTSISFKYAAEWSLFTDDDGCPLTKVVTSILEQDLNNTATKMRLNFYKNFTSAGGDSDVLAVQVIIETLDKDGYVETNVRYNLSNAQIAAINDFDASGATNAELDANRLDENATIANYDATQVYDWSAVTSGGNNISYNYVLDWDDLSSNLHFRGYEFTRRVPFSVLAASSFFFPTKTVTNNVLGATTVMTNQITDTNNSQNGWILALYIIVGLVILFQVIGAFSTLNRVSLKR
jgi:hypothetical protein